MKKYVVRDGDTMWSISKATGVRLNLLMAANPQIRDPNKLQAGSVIAIPELDKSKATGPTVSQTQVGTKNNPAEPPITTQHSPFSAPVTGFPPAGPSMPATQGGQGPLAGQNYPEVMAPAGQPGAQYPEVMAPTGQPGAQYPETPEAVPPYFGFVWPHSVRQGETWETISDMYGLTVQQLRQMNPTLTNRVLRAGDIVYVPGAAGPAPGQGPGMGTGALPPGMPATEPGAQMYPGDQYGAGGYPPVQYPDQFGHGHGGLYGPGQVGAGQYGPGQYVPGQYVPGQYGPGQYGPGQYGPGQYGPGQYPAGYPGQGQPPRMKRPVGMYPVMPPGGYAPWSGYEMFYPWYGYGQTGPDGRHEGGVPTYHPHAYYPHGMFWQGQQVPSPWYQDYDESSSFESSWDDEWNPKMMHPGKHLYRQEPHTTFPFNEGTPAPDPYETEGPNEPS